MTNSVKIFGIGLSRTGSTSLCHTMKLLGFTAIHYPKSLQEIDEHAFSNDSPVSARFELLDQKYANAKFIYTKRDIDEWVVSCLKLFPKKDRLSQIKNLPSDLKEWWDYGDINLYGYDMLAMADITKDELVYAYHEYDKRVTSWFKNRASDLLVIDVTKPEVMPLTTLIGFLEQHKLIAFPRLNSGSGGFHFYGESPAVPLYFAKQ